MNKEDLTHFIKASAINEGFAFCGIAKAGRLDDDERRLEQWLANGMHGEMQYMERNIELRVNPEKLLPGARSVISFLYNYFPSQQQNAGTPKIAKYAYGEDYHTVIRKKLNSLLHAVREKAGDFEGRGFVDSAPVLEKSWAMRSGLGWIGKNGNLINKEMGSFFFIATIITDLELCYDDPFAKDYCGNCRRCIDACPTNAIGEDKVINGSQCISYYTIELKSLLSSSDIHQKWDDWIFGCDICQDVCPWNRFSKPTTDNAFTPISEILHFTKDDWTSLNEDAFKTIFHNSPLKRAKFSGLQRNLKFISKTSDAISVID